MKNKLGIISLVLSLIPWFFYLFSLLGSPTPPFWGVGPFFMFYYILIMGSAAISIILAIITFFIKGENKIYPTLALLLVIALPLTYFIIFSQGGVM